MTQSEIKHQDELYKAAPIIKELGYTPNINMCGDKPDLVLPSIENRRIGIEVVKYSTHRYEESENALYKIFYVANQIIGCFLFLINVVNQLLMIL